MFASNRDDEFDDLNKIPLSEVRKILSYLADVKELSRGEIAQCAGISLDTLRLVEDGNEEMADEALLKLAESMGMLLPHLLSKATQHCSPQLWKKYMENRGRV